MKLKYIILRHLAITLSLLIAVWAVLFYVAMVNEINDETDDTLDEYAEQIIIRTLAGEMLPSTANGTNHSYHIRQVTTEYAMHTQLAHYEDKMIYLEEKGETEPARVLSMIYIDKEKQYYEIVVAIPTIEKEDLKSAILFYIVVLYFVLLLAILLVNAWVFRKAMRPLYKVLQWLNSYAIGKPNKPLDNPTKIVEFSQLNRAAMEHSVRSEEIFKAQQLFIGNASHELQTPIAICQNRLELLAQQIESEEQMIEIAKIEQTLSHMAKLNKTLLLLSKLDNQQFPTTKAIQINELMYSLIDTYAEVFLSKKITLQLDLREVLTWQMDDSLAQVLLGNLIKNAYVHNYTNGNITIVIESNSFTIINTGVGEPLSEENLYKLFYQRKKQAFSSGLGLALTKSICNYYQLAIQYDYCEGRHSFKIFR